MESPYTQDLKDDTDLSLHDPNMQGKRVKGSGVSPDAYAWIFVVVAVGLLWAIGGGFRSVNS